MLELTILAAFGLWAIYQIVALVTSRIQSNRELDRVRAVIATKDEAERAAMVTWEEKKRLRRDRVRL